MLNGSFYVATDKNGTIKVFFYKPSKHRNEWFCNNAFNDGVLLEISKEELPPGVNPMWSDVEPIEVMLNLLRK